MALSTSRGPGLVAGMLGVMKAGAAWVPMDPAYPAPRLADMMDPKSSPFDAKRMFWGGFQVIVDV